MCRFHTVKNFLGNQARKRKQTTEKHLIFFLSQIFLINILIKTDRQFTQKRSRYSSAKSIFICSLYEVFDHKIIVYFKGIKTNPNKMYANAEEMSILITKWPILIFCFNFTTISIVVASHQIFLDWMQGDMDPQHWTLTYQLR